MEPIILKESPVGEFYLERPPPNYLEALEHTTEHDRHFLEIYLRGFLYLTLALLISSTRAKGKKRGEITLVWLSDLKETLGITATQDSWEGIFHWKLMPEYSQKIIPEIKNEVLELANEIVADFLIIMFEVLSLEDGDEKNRKKNLVISELEDLAEKMKGKNLPPD